MSIATMNWAFRQRLETHQQQILLYVIADSADPNGVTRHCDPDYLVKHSRLSRATMFRRLAEIEALGVLARRKYYTEAGAPRYEITLNLEVLIDVPIRTRRAGDEDADGEGDAVGPESHAETLAPESHAETLVSETKVSPVRLPQSHSCDCIGPPLSEGLPPNPPPGGSLSKQEVEQGGKRDQLWRQFTGVYPGISAMDQQAARQALDQLSVNDAEWAVSVCPAYDAECRKLKKPPKNAHLWLRKGMFRNFAKAKIAAPPREGVWVAEGSAADRALRLVRMLARQPNPYLRRGPAGDGYMHKTEVGPDLLAMLAFADEVPLRWPAVDLGTPHGAAWQARFREWIGQGMPHELGSNLIRVPTLWPPKKNGTIYRDDTPDDDTPEEGSAS